MAAVAVNGSFMTLTYAAGEDGNLTASTHSLHGEGVAIPVNIMLCDSRGEAVRVVIGGPDKAMVFH